MNTLWYTLVYTMVNSIILLKLMAKLQNFTSYCNYIHMKISQFSYLLNFSASFCSSVAHTPLLHFRSMPQKMWNCSSPFPRKISMTFPICSLSPCKHVTVCASPRPMKPPAGISSMFSRPSDMNTLVMRASFSAINALSYQELMRTAVNRKKTNRASKLSNKQSYGMHLCMTLHA